MKPSGQKTNRKKFVVMYKQEGGCPNGVGRSSFQAQNKIFAATASPDAFAVIVNQPESLLGSTGDASSPFNIFQTIKLNCMKKKLFVFVVASVSVAGLFSCGAKCKTCYVEVMGVKSGEKELCGDQLKQAENTPGMICK